MSSNSSALSHILRGLICIVVASAHAIIIVYEGIAPREQQHLPHNPTAANSEPGLRHYLVVRGRKVGYTTSNDEATAWTVGLSNASSRRYPTYVAALEGFISAFHRGDVRILDEPQPAQAENGTAIIPHSNVDEQKRATITCHRNPEPTALATPTVNDGIELAVEPTNDGPVSLSFVDIGIQASDDETSQVEGGEFQAN